MTRLSLPTERFWRGKRVLITGHTGFKGAWMGMWLQNLGAEVYGLSLPPPAGDSLFAEGFPGDHRLAADLGDIRDPAAVEAAFEQARPQIVIHMAAQAVVRRSIAHPIESFATNVLGTAHVLDAARRSEGLRAIVNVTSDKCYQNNEWVWAYREADPLGGKDPYSASKACAELVGQAFRSTFFGEGSQVRLASARAGNVIGGGDWAQDRLLPDCMRAFARGEPVLVRNPVSTRPWQHVLEPIAGYLLLAQALFEQPEGMTEAWNFGPAADQVRQVADVVDIVAERWGEPASITMAPTTADASHEAVLLQVDSSKARSVLGWRTRLDFNDTISWTVDWYRRRHAGEASRTLCLEQIANYEAR